MQKLIQEKPSADTKKKGRSPVARSRSATTVVALDTTLQKEINQYLDGAPKRLFNQPEELVLIERAQASDKNANDALKARNDLIEAHLRWIVRIALRYANPFMTLGDCVGYGVLGFIRAISEFDTARGLRLNTYATGWIRHFIQREADEQRNLVHIPANRLADRSKIKKTAGQLLQQLGHDPTLGQIAIVVGMSPQHVSSILQEALPTQSLDEPTRDRHSQLHTLADTLFKVEPATPFALSDEQRQQLHSILKDNLNSYELAVIHRRFGFAGFDEMTLDEIGKEFKLTREAIRQTQNKAYAKIRRQLELLLDRQPS
ncbi:MAG TPA: sigma-70 family RNA polymerase sigma factor [Candidatus Acidoferrum sp.]|nr:sigma-70 family RNA polymerase sigma factor [Candidatus Acidoferrum sp.]